MEELPEDLRDSRRHLQPRIASLLEKARDIDLLSQSELHALLGVDNFYTAASVLQSLRPLTNPVHQRLRNWLVENLGTILAAEEAEIQRALANGFKPTTMEDIRAELGRLARVLKVPAKRKKPRGPR